MNMCELLEVVLKYLVGFGMTLISRDGVRLHVHVAKMSNT